MTSKEEKDLRALVQKNATDRPVFLTQEEGKTLFEEIDVLRQEKSAAVKHTEHLVRKYADDAISESVETMLTELSVLHNDKRALLDFLSTAGSMLQRASRLECSHGARIYDSSITYVTCEHCEIVKHLVEMIEAKERK